jgi:hypothetical protein
MVDHLDMTTDISDKLFLSFMGGLTALVVLSILPSVASMFEYCQTGGFSTMWSVCIPAVTDLMIVIGHLGAVWLGVRGDSVGRLMLLVYLGAAASIGVNLLHAPQTGPSLSFFSHQIFATQIIGMFPPVFLLVSSNAALYIIELKLHGAKRVAEKLQREREMREKKESQISLKKGSRTISINTLNDAREKGVTMSALAEKLGVSTATIHRRKKKLREKKESAN